MHGFLTGINAEVKGYTAKEQFEMRYTPDGTAVGTLRVGCGGTDKQKATFVDIEIWGSGAEELNEMGVGKGMAVIAEGVIVQKTWEYKKKWYNTIKVVYLDSLSVESDGKFVTITLDKKPGKEKEAVAAGVAEGAEK